ncbi:hypothetical protein HDU87_001309 [Geranomyces variabilis]|uniref:SMP-30/Gluconolactonase/LRE-like region domain-containing protein n=1 Tax=Geranomyces variabilis TaxID=109894 RepID=A0AAD5TMJ1_9FUNG|nr:hypothetical protein HDU87_001309 [Geranomyces variabilis]
MPGVLTASFALGIAAVAIWLGPALQIVWRLHGIRPTFSAINTSSCRVLDDPYLNGCEQSVIHSPSGLAFLACAVDTSIRSRWFPPLFHYDQEAALTPKGAIVVLNLKTAKATPLKLEGFPPTFHPHGMSVITSPENPDEVLIGAVNHRPDGSTIELFSHNLKSHTAQHLETFKDEKILFAPNDLELVDRHSFYATNDRGHAKHLGRLALGWAKGGHVIFKDADGKARVVADKLDYPNGIALSADKHFVWVADASQAQVIKFERKPNNGLRLRDVVELPHFSDNISVEPTTGAVYVAGIQEGFSCSVVFARNGFACPAAVTKITNNTDQDVFFGKKYKTQPVFVDDGSRIEAISTAGVHLRLKKSIAGGIGKGVVMCDEAW